MANGIPCGRVHRLGVYSKSESECHSLSSCASFASVATAETHYGISEAREGRYSAHMCMDDGFDAVC